jgi:hypothetical protein
MDHFRTTRASGAERIQKTLFSSHRSECTHCTAKARRQLPKAAANGPPQDSLVTVRPRSRWQVLHRPGGIRSRWAASRSRSAWRLPVSSGLAGRRVTSAWITAASLGWAGDERGPGRRPTGSRRPSPGRPAAERGWRVLLALYSHAMSGSSTVSENSFRGPVVISETALMALCQLIDYDNLDKTDQKIEPVGHRDAKFDARCPRWSSKHARFHRYFPTADDD